MKTKIYSRTLGGSFLLVMLLALSANASAAKRYVFSGGPAGGTFQVVANAIQVYDPVKKEFKVKAQSSAGSIENLRKVNKGRAHFGVVYSGHTYLGRNGKLKNDTRKYEDVLAVSYLYGAPAQLVVRANSGITSTKDLVGKKVGVGNAGSGAFANCELFFTHLGIWDEIERNAMGYNDAASAFGNKQLDAFWLFTAYPSPAVIQAATMNEIELVDLDADAKNFVAWKIPTSDGRYRGLTEDVPSWVDTTLLVANPKAPEDLVYGMLKAIFTEEGLAWMVSQKKTFKAMSVEKGIKGVATPLHPGAEKFWKEMGVLK